MLKAIIFDFDGVLGDTCAMSIEVCRVFKPGLTDESFLNQYNGNVYHDNNKIRFTDEESDFFFQEMNKRFEEKHLFPFKKDLPLLGDQYSLFVVSSTRESSLEKYLKCGDLLEIFEWLMGSETHRSKVVKFKMIFEKYNLLSNECLFFTDTLGDIREANEVNLPSVGVTWGYHDFYTLQKGNPRKIISEFDEVVLTIEEYKDKKVE